MPARTPLAVIVSALLGLHAVAIAQPAPTPSAPDGPGAAAETPAAGTTVDDAPAKCPDDIAAIASQIIADAETRGSLLGHAGHDNMFFIASADDRLRLNIGGYVQFRYLADFRDDPPGGGPDYEGGFTLTRVRLIFAGSLKDPGVDFLVLPYVRGDGSWSVLDAWARHTFESKWSVKAGQSKLPFLREYLVSERFILAAERSNLTAAFAAVYSQSVETCYTGESLAVHLAFSNGWRTFNTDLDSPKRAEYALTGRVQYKFQGQWKQFFDMTAHGNEEHATMVGAAIHHQGRTDDFAGVEVSSVTQYTLDLTHEGLDWSAMAMFVGRQAAVADGPDRSEYGLLAQAAYLPAQDLEVFGRYSILFPDRDVPRNNTFSAVTAGINFYFHGHAAKLTTDVVWFVDDLEGTDVLGFGPNTALGLLPTTTPNEVAIRAQFQLIF